MIKVRRDFSVSGITPAVVHHETDSSSLGPAGLLCSVHSENREGLRWLDESIRRLVDQFCLSQTDDTVFSVLLESDPPSPYRSLFRGEIQYTLLH